MTIHIYDDELGEIAVIVEDHEYYVHRGQEGNFHQEHIDAELEVLEMTVVLEDGTPYDDWKTVYNRHRETINAEIWQEIYAGMVP